MLQHIAQIGNVHKKWHISYISLNFAPFGTPVAAINTSRAMQKVSLSNKGAIVLPRHLCKKMRN